MFVENIIDATDIFLSGWREMIKIDVKLKCKLIYFTLHAVQFFLWQR